MFAAMLAIISLAALDLPVGSAPEPVPIPHFPDATHAFIWRNWQLVPAERMAAVIGANKEDVLRIGRSMGLDGPAIITSGQQRRSYITVIRRNWHLLPYNQLLELLGWTEEKLAYTLREDDFLYVKLGNLKPNCKPIRYSAPDTAAVKREREIAEIVKREFPNGVSIPKEPLFDFVRQLSIAPLQKKQNSARPTPNAHSPSPIPHPRFCYSYFALYGDPLLDTDADPYPDGYLARLAEVGVNGVWLQAVLYKLAPFPWDPHMSERFQERLANLRSLVRRAKKHGINVYLYLNEPRA